MSNVSSCAPQLIHQFQWGTSSFNQNAMVFLPAHGNRLRFVISVQRRQSSAAIDDNRCACEEESLPDKCTSVRSGSPRVLVHSSPPYLVHRSTLSPCLCRTSPRGGPQGTPRAKSLQLTRRSCVKWRKLVALSTKPPVEIYQSTK